MVARRGLPRRHPRPDRPSSHEHGYGRPSRCRRQARSLGRRSQHLSRRRRREPRRGHARRREGVRRSPGLARPSPRRRAGNRRRVEVALRRLPLPALAQDGHGPRPGLDRRLLREGRRKTAVAKRAGLESVVVASAVGSARSALRSPAGPSPRAASALSRSRPLLFRSGRPLPSSPPGFLTAQRLSPSVRLRPLSRGPASRRPAVRQRPEPPCRPYARLL